MTDIHRPPNPVQASDSADSQPNHSAVKVNTVKIGASAGAAVTSAVAASFFGTNGTLIGAAFGAIVSTMASDLYTRSLNRAATRIQVTRTMVAQKLPGDAGAERSVRQYNGGEPAGGSNATFPVPVEPSFAVEDRAEPARPAGPTHPTGPTGAGHSVGPGEARRFSPWWKRGGVMVGVAGFVVAIGVITGVEGILQHPISGGSGGTSISHSVKEISSNTDTSSSDDTSDDTTSTGTATPTDSASPSDSAAPGASPSAAEVPVTTPTTATAPAAPTATTDPNVSSSADTGSDSVQSTPTGNSDNAAAAAGQETAAP
jgi:hypothetical protein